MERDAIVGRLKELVAVRRRVDLEIIRALRELAEGRGELELGFGSLFVFCTEGLGLAESTSSKFVACAELIAKVPAAEAMLEDRRLKVSTLAAMKKVLRPDNAGELLAWAAGKTERQVKERVADLLGNQGVIERVGPIGGGRYEVTALMDSVGVALLEEGRALLSHVVRDGSIGAVIGKALEIAVPIWWKQRARSAERPALPRGSAGAGRYVPAWMVREVYQRAQGCCEFDGADGRRCRSVWCLQVDHVDGVANGPPTVGRLRLLCARHNRLAAERVFGRMYMEQFAP